MTFWIPQRGKQNAAGGEEEEEEEEEAEAAIFMKAELSRSWRDVRVTNHPNLHRLLTQILRNSDKVSQKSTGEQILTKWGVLCLSNWFLKPSEPTRGSNDARVWSPGEELHWRWAE